MKKNNIKKKKGKKNNRYQKFKIRISEVILDKAKKKTLAILISGK